MSDKTSIADRAVRALASVDSIGKLLTLSDPHRHLVWTLQESAKAILSEAFSRAESIANLARDAERIFQEIKKQKP